MKLTEAKAQAQKGVDDYENGRITLSALLTLIDLTVEGIYKEGYKDGLHDAVIDDGDTEIEFDAEFDLEGNDLDEEE